ncbi:hypothetical protein NDU88_001814 [Pleurodeles waltl]|uniref:Uncharacterized protein n=1 Tax=Pleurodeles waltl TaxID=8319 RepID=A0AAV7LC55_PLEWA|nr:hypothetical protein NDU88_001814 [Pleurodeles waltl]
MKNTREKEKQLLHKPFLKSLIHITYECMMLFRPVPTKHYDRLLCVTWCMPTRTLMNLDMVIVLRGRTKKRQEHNPVLHHRPLPVSCIKRSRESLGAAGREDDHRPLPVGCIERRLEWMLYTPQGSRQP